jgi:hypothetical protein
VISQLQNRLQFSAPSVYYVFIVPRSLRRTAASTEDW